LLPELKIILYVIFVVGLFFINDPVYYWIIFTIIFLLLFKIPVKILKKGWIPISIFLTFTFFSNLLFRHGKVLYTAGPLLVTAEGLTDASIKTMRILFMIAGAKLLTGTTSVESLTRAFGRVLKPLQHVGIPVNEFVSTMGLTLKSIPVLKEQFLTMYREKMQQGTIHGFVNRARIVSAFLLPLFVKSIQTPEQFFEKTKKDER
jgi:energy-coupling factor transport system permease protein